MNILEHIAAERAIERLIIGYAALNDAGNWEAVAALYVENGRMSRPTAPDDFIEGHDAILAAFRARPPRSTRHICANIRVTIENINSAMATSEILLFSGAGQTPLVGSYEDRVACREGHWRFVERRGRLSFPGD